ncbi:GNAT family N-acetyltransferase [Streptomyces phytophilus]|uniref:GNAT family N-acetyltransferase n=1 Tax=Streptomyces phytophilus TaxID=722715 RepID=UPI0015EFFE38|nr:GNAT family N-acetyltransferase [Streptomyces phytophilus]
MIVRLAEEGDFSGFLALAAGVEEWFGPMVGEAGFHDAVRGCIRRARALVAESGGGVAGGLLFGGEAPVFRVHWLVVAEDVRGQGVGQALMGEAERRFVRGRGAGCVEVVTFGADHPGAVVGGARVFYERLGFRPAGPAPDGPEGGTREVFRRVVGE